MQKSFIGNETQPNKDTSKTEEEWRICKKSSHVMLLPYKQGNLRPCSGRVLFSVIMRLMGLSSYM